MFKKLKDKLAEEVKSSPQRIQQFAQAAQAAVTSASSSISDITNSELFSIGDNDSQQNRLVKGSPSNQKSSSTIHDMSFIQPGSLQTSNDSMDFASAQDMSDNQRQRRLSNSSFASDVSFRLPSYESPSMYHLQSDIEVSASEAEERGFSSGNVSLDRVTKEQIYAAYRRTQERYSKYRTQYADLARHYKLLERENAKARSVLVETQDKALRRISELREQCSLEQSAKAHLEKALRVEIEEKNLKIDTLNTKISFLQNTVPAPDENELTKNSVDESNTNVQLISFDNENKQTVADEQRPPSETQTLNTKNEKLEKLLNKYKDSLKTTKEKCAQLTTEIQILSGDLENKNKEVEQLRSSVQQLDENQQKIRELNYLNEELQNKINVYDFNKNKEMSTLELDLQKAQEEISYLQNKIDVFSKREEEYAISLAENKLSIHKELESKEAEIKSLKDHLTESRQEIQSLDIVLNDYKNNNAKLLDECSKLKNDISELNSTKLKINELESQIQELNHKCQSLENLKTKAEEEYKCLQLQLKQETAEKLAIIDRNVYLENRNTQLTEENTKKSLQLNALDKKLLVFKKEMDTVSNKDDSDRAIMIEDINTWKNKCTVLESEIQEEREELVKLQSEIEKLLANDEHIQTKNAELNTLVTELKTENDLLKEIQFKMCFIKSSIVDIGLQIKDLKKNIYLATEDTISLKEINNDYALKFNEALDDILQQYKCLNDQSNKQTQSFKIEIQKKTEEIKVLNEENLKMKTEIQKYDVQNTELTKKLQSISEQYNQSLNDLKSTQNEKEKVIKQLNEYQARYQVLQDTIENNKSEQIILKQKLAVIANENGDDLKKENQILCEQLNASNCKCEQLQNIVNQYNNEHTTLNQNISDLTENIKKLECTIEFLQNEKNLLCKNFDEANAKCEILQDIINRNNTDQTILKEKIDNFEHNIKQLYSEKHKLSTDLEEACAKSEILQDIINRHNNEQTILKETLNKLEHENDELKNLIKDLQDNITILRQENYKLIESNKATEASNEKLHYKINELTQDNMSLKTQSEDITDSIKDLEVQLRDVRNSHTEIELEKDHLSSIIEQLEINESKKECFEKNTQTNNDNTEQTFEEIKLSGELSQKPASNDKDQALVTESDTLVEENKRLQSDVAGLQTYLAKISKENSVLNDKLRELIATSGHSQDDLNLSDFSNEVQQEKEKLHELIRENNLLVEENLELKDQLNSQHYGKNESAKNNDIGKDMEYLTLKEKYSSLLDINMRLEKRMLDLEQMNQSVNGNVTQMQQHNEKLRLTNEKLERRLDEALVSLRHLHALQENTELEYLKNILYEYLTGTGAHSVTLAKVLAAVVKFDRNQTEIVLQKEKERQGFLRQLGLL